MACSSKRSHHTLPCSMQHALAAGEGIATVTPHGVLPCGGIQDVAMITGEGLQQHARVHPERPQCHWRQTCRAGSHCALPPSFCPEQAALPANRQGDLTACEFGVNAYPEASSDMQPSSCISCGNPTWKTPAVPAGSLGLAHYKVVHW